MDEGFSYKGFGKGVGKVVVCIDIFDSEGTVVDAFTDVVVTYIDVFSSAVEGRVAGEL